DLIGLQRDQLPRESPDQLRVAGRGPADVDPNVAALDPSELLEPFPERCSSLLPFPVALGKSLQYSDAAYTLALLRARRERPRGRAAEQRDERAASHSIASSAMASSVGGISRPSAFAVFRLITSSNLVD